MPDWVVYLALFVTGCIAGLVNVVSAGGSFLTLPILIFLGLPASVANGTNRVAILLQNAGAVWSFHRYGVVDWRAAWWAALPCTAGGLVGAWAALRVSDAAFQKILSVVMVAVTIWMLWEPLRRAERQPSAQGPVRTVALGLGFFAAGLYGGFLQAGVGFLLLAATTGVAGLDLVRGNAIKVLSILAQAIASLALFVWAGKVAWAYGLALAAGTLLGGLFGVRLAVQKGHAWLRGVVTFTLLALALKLWFTG